MVWRRRTVVVGPGVGRRQAVAIWWGLLVLAAVISRGRGILVARVTRVLCLAG